MFKSGTKLTVNETQACSFLYDKPVQRTFFFLALSKQLTLR